MLHALLAVVAFIVVLVSMPAAAAPCAGFTDVEDTSPFCPNVAWLRNRSITLGCTATTYCPNDPVTRLQMAAFMNRLGDSLFPLTCAAGQVMKWDGVNWGCANDNIGGSGGGGTVTSVAAGTGLQASPNPITGAGAINLAQGYQLPQGCANGQVAKSNGAGGWTCQNDNDTNSGGTVTSVTAGTGLQANPNPITGVGAINLAPSYQLPQSCANGQVAKSNGAGGWTCAADNDTNSGGTVTSLAAGTGITLTPNPITASGAIAVNTTTIQQRVSGTCAVGSSIRAIAADGTVTCQTDTAGPANAFVHNGNAFGATAVLGSTDNNALDVRVNNSRVMRYEPNAISPNVIGGSPANSVAAGVRGATIAGGGVPLFDTDPDFCCGAPNQITDAYGTVGGGVANRAGDDSGTTMFGAFATVGGGSGNTASGGASTVGGGSLNFASGGASTVGGGSMNIASGLYSTIVGGRANIARGFASTVAGGVYNIARGDYSWAGGYRAVTHTGGPTPTVHNGAFVWADNNDFDFNSTADNEFSARATGGVRFVTAIDGATPTRTVRINPNGEVEFGSQVRQMLNLYGPTWAIGVQAGTQYFRTGNHFGWYLNGVHSDNPLDPGAGGSMLMTLTNGASTSTVTGTLRAQVVTATSDRAQKTDFAGVDAQEVLARVVELPIETWAYRNEPGVRHMGPTGQAFRAAFALGSDEKSIATVDADGVALAAIQGLNAKLAEQAREIERLRAIVERLASSR